MKHRQYYVWNDKVKHKVDDGGKGPMYAIAVALSKSGYADQTEIPDDVVSWPFFYVDERGFRSQPELFAVSIDLENKSHANLIQEGASIPIMKEAALNWFDHYMNEYDPFCEREDENDA